MKIHFLLFIAIAFMYACTQSTTIQPNTFANILLDIHLADAHASIIYQNDSSKKINIFSKNTDSLKTYYANIFTKYNISETQFMQDMQWYKQHPIELDSIYKTVQVNLSLLQLKKDSTSKK